MEILVNSENPCVGDEMPCILGTPPRPCVLAERIALPGMTQQKAHWHMGARLNEATGEEQGSKQNKGFFLQPVQADRQWLKRCLLLPQTTFRLSLVASTKNRPRAQKKSLRMLDLIIGGTSSPVVHGR